jgi:hypothetical protein
MTVRLSRPDLFGGHPRAARALGRVVACAVLTCALAGAPLAAQDLHRGIDGDTTGTLPVVDSTGACVQGTITAIDVDSRSVFDPESTRIAPLAWTYRLLNLLHVNTNQAFIRRELLFEEGDCYDPFLLQESYRLLDQYGFMMVENITNTDDGLGNKRVQVITRDEWSTKIDIGPTYDEDNGLSLERLQVTEENFLGNGVFAEFTHYSRRETRNQSIGLRTPRFFGRSDAGIAVGRTRSGNFIDQYWRYPFLGEANRVAFRQGFISGTDFFAFGTGGSQTYTQVLVPVQREFAELSAAYRFGSPGASLILGGSLTRDVVKFPDPIELTFGDFDEREDLPAGSEPPELLRQLAPLSATRAAVHLGIRRIRYREYVGLDALREPYLAGLGVYAGATVGRTLGIFGASGVPEESDWYARSHVSITEPLGPSLLHLGARAEGRHVEAGWRDILAEGELVAYGRASWLPWQTLFFRMSTASSWETTLPYQLSLGGREGVRSLAEDRFPGGRMVRFVAEDRIVLPWPSDTADLGFTVFGDLGRVWAAEAPYGVNSGWQAAAGFGLRIGLPNGTRNVWRTDIAFPVGGDTSGGPVFRVNLELNRLRSGFATPEVVRSHRFLIGPETF